MFLVNMSFLQAQHAINKEPALIKEQQWLFDKTRKQMTTKGENASTKLFLDKYRKLLLSDVFCKKVSSQTKINLDGERLNENNTLIEWDVFEETEYARYIVERRYNNPYGDFDSIGIMESRGAASVFQSYQFSDNNDFPGTSWYRLRRIHYKGDMLKLVKVEGYKNEAKVFPNQAKSSDVRIELFRFKTDGNNSIIIHDSRGSIVHYREQVFVNDNKVYQLQNLGLAPGAYHIKVSNQYNSGSTTFIVQ
jgi:hypothetical protein